MHGVKSNLKTLAVNILIWGLNTFLNLRPGLRCDQPALCYLQPILLGVANQCVFCRLDHIVYC